MKLPLIFILSTYFLLGTDVSNVHKAHKRWMEFAHPTPKVSAVNYVTLPLDFSTAHPIFLNSNTIIIEEGTFPTQNESSIAVNPMNPDNLIASAVDYRNDSEAKVYVSHDGGLTWENIFLGRPYAEWRSSNDPSVAFDKDGTGYLCYGAFEGTNSYFKGNGIYVARSEDEGRTWTPHLMVIEHTGEFQPDTPFEDKYYIHVDNAEESPYRHHIYIPWKRMMVNDSSTQIIISKSTDKGNSWSEPSIVSDRLPNSVEDTTFGQSFPLARTGPEGEVYVVWNHGVEHGVGFAKSHDGADSFSKPEIIHNYEIFGETRDISGTGEEPEFRHTVKGTVRAEAYPSMDVDLSGGQNGGNIYLCWAADNPPDIFFSKSTDKGETWTETKIIHENPANDQFWPWLAVDQTTGDIAIMYLDSREDPDNYLVECWVSFSSDAGETWIDRRVSEIPFDLTRNPFGGVFSGDYNGIAFHDGIIYPSWVDMRNAVQNIFDNDVFTAIINVNAPLPVENFESEFSSDEPQKLRLGWDVNFESSFGKSLNINDFNIVIYRNGVLVAELRPDVNSYNDEGLVPYSEYKYSIVAASSGDTSLARVLTSYPGGSKKPDSPELLGWRPMDNNGIKLWVKLPEYRADGKNMVVNLDKLFIYADDGSKKEFRLTASDAGKNKELIFEMPERGYYTFEASVIDSFFEEQEWSEESERSEPMVAFAGFLSIADADNGLFFDFNSDFGNLFHATGQFGITNEFSFSLPASITESPGANYPNSYNAELWLNPIDIRHEKTVGNELEKAAQSISFMLAADLSTRDSCFIEVSYDFADSWQQLYPLPSDDYPTFWLDGELSVEDWTRQNLLVLGKNRDGNFYSGDTVIIRFRFASNAFGNAEGWYIDDFETGMLITGVDEDPGIFTTLYPQPAGDFTRLSMPASLGSYSKTISVYSITGIEVASNAGFIGSTFDINTSEFPPGLYFVRIKAGEHIINKTLLVNRK